MAVKWRTLALGFILLSFLVERTLAQGSSCTGSGGNKDGPCIFPFKYQGTSQTQCGDYGNYGNGDWCATEVDADGEYTKYGFCTCTTTTTTTTAATTTTSTTPCIVELDTKYDGANVMDPLSGPKQPDWRSCQLFCLANYPAASYFKYSGITDTTSPYYQTCACKTSKTGSSAVMGVVSGDVNCEGGQVQITIEN